MAPPLQKLLGKLIMPAGWLWVAFAAIAAYFWWKGRRRDALLWTGAFAVYSIVGNVWLGCWLVKDLESEVAVEALDTGGPYDAIFVLGGGTKLGPDRYPEVGDVGDRLILAARLYRAGKAPLLVSSGQSVPGLGDARDLTVETETIWKDLGIPAEAMRSIPEPWNTSMEVEAYARMIAQEGWKKVALLSSAWHLPRVRSLCRARGLDAVFIAADHQGEVPPASIVYLVPQSYGFEQVTRAFWERVGMAVGR